MKFYRQNRLIAAVLSLAAAFSLTACGADEFAVTTFTTIRPSQTEPTAEPETPTVKTLPSELDGDARYAFSKALWDACLRGVLPDGEALDWFSAEEAAQNDFALYDVDGDGQEELLLYWTNAAMAGTRLDVFGYRDGAVFTELSISPFETFYDNGMVVDKWSHNHGMAANTDFWPYFLHTYDAETDTYQNIYIVDAWSRELGTHDVVDYTPFPTDIDADGDGMVYFLAPADQNNSLYSMEYLVDGPKYEAWLSSYLDGAEPLDLQSHTQKLTEDHIAALGCPRPEVELSEPAG